MHTLADYIRQNLHGGQSLDILGLRSLNPTPVEVDTAAELNASLRETASGLPSTLTSKFRVIYRIYSSAICEGSDFGSVDI